MCLLTAWLRPGDLAVDVGAHHGTYTKRFATAVGRTGHVLAFEPDEGSRARWLKASKDWPQATVYPYAVSDGLGTRAWYQGGASEQHSLWASNLAHVKQTQLVETVTLDVILDGQTPRAIKIDAQGADVHVLRGAHDTLQTPGLKVMVEVWPAGLVAAGESVQTLADLLTREGYAIEAEGKDPKPSQRTWAEFVRATAKWTGHTHTNLIVVKAA